MRLISCGTVIIRFVLATNISYGDELQPADSEFFESKVRPLLIARCQECHGENKPKSGLRLDSRAAILTGGESGPAAVVGKPDESLLVDVVSYRNSIQMPPKAKLPDADIAILTEWVRRGLPWPNSAPVTNPARPDGVIFDFTDEQKSFWAFQPVQRLQPAKVNNVAWTQSPIDQFLLAELESKQLLPSKPVDKRRLIRRVTIDLIGLLPSVDEVVEFANDDSPDALERVVDRLLASPRYSERWARHWLDVARYADSNGLDENLAYANAYRYRDYVVRAFNEDKPYDQFLLEQIAGDLLEPKNSDATASANGLANHSSFDPLIATGFLCLGAKMLAEDDPVKMHMDIIDEQVDTISRAVMGLTMGCARCHDHKYDPLTIDDYYALAGVFKSTQTMDTFSVVAQWHERPLATPIQIQQRDALQQLATAQKQVVDKLKAEQTEVVLNDARRHSGQYLLVATNELILTKQQKHAKPRGNDPGWKSIPGAILIEAEDYARGNVLKDRDNYGKGIGVLVNRGETPNFTEYEVVVKEPTTYQFELRYAAAGSRPVKFSVNERLVKPDAASKVTGSWTPDSQTWFIECNVTLATGKNVIRLEQPQFFPHIDQLLLTPIEAVKSSQNVSPSLLGVESKIDDQPKLVASLVSQWTKRLEQSRSDPNSILTGWHQFVASQRLTPDPANANNAVARLLGQEQPASLDNLAQRYDRLFREAMDAWTAWKSTEDGRDAASLEDPILEAVRLLLFDPKGPLAAPSDIETQFKPEIVMQLKSGRDELARREAAVPKFAETMAVAESKPENLKIHLRGSHLTLGKEVPRQMPRILQATGSRELNQGSGRLQFARWLASSDHLLTSRVMVNRVWQWHFGNGLVRSPDNFGRLGERPSHPALLDWLASEFAGTRSDVCSNPSESSLNSVPQESTNQHVRDNPILNPTSNVRESAVRGWSLKSMHRRLIETAAYRQGSEQNSAAALLDPENRLLWRFPRQRMDVEVLRDSLLALSGLLDDRLGGTLLPTPNRAYVTSTANVNPAIYSSHRRSIYLPVVRSALFDVFTAFDFADPSTLAGQRDQTTVAPQALFMMNSQFVLDQSHALAGRLIEETSLDARGRLRRLYNVAYSRDPSETEIGRALGYSDRLTDAIARSGVSGMELELRVWTSLCRAIVAANEFIYVD